MGRSVTTEFTIDKLEDIFCRFGLSDSLVSDNGTQFTSSEFQNFMNRLSIKHKLTAPGHPATNGQAENGVKTFKSALTKSVFENSNVDVGRVIKKFLFDYRTTKHCTTGESPSKLLMNRELKTRFNLLRPPSVKDVVEQKQKNQQKNFSGKRNTIFCKGDKVIIRDYSNPNKKQWTDAVVEKVRGPRSFMCTLSNGRNILRHTNQIRMGAQTQASSTLSPTPPTNPKIQTTNPNQDYNQIRAKIPIIDTNVETENSSDDEDFFGFNDNNLSQCFKNLFAENTINIRKSSRATKTVDRLNL